MNATAAAGTLLELGRQKRGAVIEADVRNGSAGAEVRVDILARQTLQATGACSEPDCLASARYDVAYPPFPTDD